MLPSSSMLSFVSGSTQGIGLRTVQGLIANGHKVVAHARTKERAEEAKKDLEGVHHIVVGDLNDQAQVRDIASELNEIGTFETIVHNAGVGYQEKSRGDGEIAKTLQVNVLAPYMLTALTNRAQKYIWLSRHQYTQAKVDLSDINWTKRKWNGQTAYIESKVYDAALGLALANMWPDVYSNIVDPGWVPTRMGGKKATDDIEKSAETQVWLADKECSPTGGFFMHKELQQLGNNIRHPGFHTDLIRACEELTGAELEI